MHITFVHVIKRKHTRQTKTTRWNWAPSLRICHVTEDLVTNLGEVVFFSYDFDPRLEQYLSYSFIPA
jgi:hypothetical protein